MNDERARSIFDLPKPVGRVAAEIGEQGLLRLHLRAPKRFSEHVPKNLKPMVRKVENALKAYCKQGSSKTTPPMVIQGTAFQEAVWKQLKATKPGHVLTYGELAKAAGYPGASRAVGSAMAANPLPIFVPCHRVVQSTGRLGNFGGGVGMKHALLEHEGCEIDSRGVVKA